MSLRVQIKNPADDPVANASGSTCDPFISVEPFQPKSGDLVPYSLLRLYAANQPGCGSLWLARVKAAGWADREPQDRLIWAHSGLWNHQIVEIDGADTTFVPLHASPLAHFPSADTGPVPVIVQSPTGQLFSTLAYARRPHG